MKRTTSIRLALATALAALSTAPALAGNPDRAGSAGATQLLLNPWARSNGWGLANTASLRGVEAMYGNVAGLSMVRKTEVGFSNLSLPGAGLSINSVGLGQKLGASGVLGISATVLSFGELDVTTYDVPEGGRGSFRPSM